MHTHLGILGVTGFLMRNLEGNPLDYVEGGQPREPPPSALRVARFDESEPALVFLARRER
jgi:hypothetical protein